MRIKTTKKLYRNDNSGPSTATRGNVNVGGKLTDNGGEQTLQVVLNFKRDRGVTLIYKILKWPIYTLTQGEVFLRGISGKLSKEATKHPLFTTSFDDQYHSC